ncbi:hypothetical protein LQ938_09565 [Microbacterium sp. cx-55]|uniref:hypothetical protein n=2 Tax=Microbacterium sp. cx-55 TaxID=2875948 RepID=UPI001E3557D7|nr:hypothetical protein [Microbacterium sp. cx-55]UGB34136.1 hypothetical protein LQ938_09565 [Microbacterium sp. cx-55]
MPAASRLNGKTKITLKFGATEYSADLVSYGLAPTDADADVITFGDVAAGSTDQWVLSGTAVQDMATSSFWNYVWANAKTEAAFTLAPQGNSSATVAQPHYTGTVTIGKKPPISAEASNSTTSYSTFDFEWNLTGEPVRKTA